jgi:hypothetical protein
MTATGRFNQQIHDVAGPAESKQHLVSVGTDLGVLNAARLKQYEFAHWLALRKKKLISRKHAGSSAGCDLKAFAFRDTGKQKRRANQEQSLSDVELSRRCRARVSVSFLYSRSRNKHGHSPRQMDRGFPPSGT